MLCGIIGDKMRKEGLRMAKVVLGLSGGVDSAVSARLLQKDGYDVFGLYMDVAGESARADAIKTAEFLNVPLKIADVREKMEQYVCEPFARAYLSGETPNPCVLCNPNVKFKTLTDYADAIGAEFVATGHYAKAKNGMLMKGEPSNDQSYMLCRLLRSQVERLILPLGGYEKKNVRPLAEAMGIPVAHKPDSMEICFIPDKDYIRWLSGRTQLPGKGEILLNGKTIGMHEGFHRYTVGQRLPGLYNERKIYVSRIDAEKNQIIAVYWDDLFRKVVRGRNANWLIDRPQTPIRGSVRVRHTKWENPDCTATVDGDGVIVECDTPVRAPARGQALAIYQGDRVVCGAWIE